MDLFDLVIVAMAVGAAIGGYRLGFLARAVSWIGLGLGLYGAGRVLPGLVKTTDIPNPTSRLLLTVATLVAGAVIGQVLGLVVGARLHDVLPIGPVRQLDRGVGAVAGIAGVLVVLWLLIPTLASVAGWPLEATTGSGISRWLSSSLPQPPDTFAVLRRLVGGNDFPQVFTDLRSGANPGTPPLDSPLSAAVTDAVSPSTVKVEGQACDRIQSGSGFVVAPGLVATNAHVVAGEPAGQTEITSFANQVLPATVVAFDANRDLALLRVPVLSARPLVLGTGSTGQSAAVFGHPEGQTRLAVQPARISQQIEAEGGNLYGTGTTKRAVFVLSAALQPGDSGGALVAENGLVVGVAFAISESNSNEAYALDITELRAVLAAPHRSAVSTRGCLDG
jgi:S1-C subfamily serine protease